MLSQELRTVAEPMVAELAEHPYWAGLRDGSLPGAALLRFVEQDTGHLLPGFGRAFARCASAAADDASVKLLTRCAFETVLSAPRLRESFASLASTMDVPVPEARPAVDPMTRAYCDTVRAGAERSFPASIGVLLPFMLFHLEICADLAKRRVAGSRYLPWLAAYEPGEGAAFAVRAVLGIADEFGQQCAPAQRAELLEWFRIGARYEWAFASSAISAELRARLDEDRQESVQRLLPNP